MLTSLCVLSSPGTCYAPPLLPHSPLCCEGECWEYNTICKYNIVVGIATYVYVSQTKCFAFRYRGSWERLSRKCGSYVMGLDWPKHTYTVQCVCTCIFSRKCSLLFVEVRCRVSLNLSRLRYGCQRCTLAVAQHCHAIASARGHSIFGKDLTAHLKFTVYGRKHSRIYTHLCNTVPPVWGHRVM